MKKKPTIQFDPHEYDYFDTLDKDGWHWEFTRRNKNYRTAYSEMEKLRKEGDAHCKNFNCFECEVISKKPCPLSQAMYVDETFRIKPLYKTVSGLNMPSPYVKYSDLPDAAKPVTFVRPKSPMEALTEKKLQTAIRDTWEERKLQFEKLWRHADSKYAMFNFVNEILSPNPRDPEATLYIGISLHATRDELRRAFQDVLKKHVRIKTGKGDTKLHLEKRKSGLMVWDIREIHRLSFVKVKDMIKIEKDAAKKQFYRVYKLIYGSEYKAADFKKPEIKKEYLAIYCDQCPQKPTCRDFCPDVFGFVNQDSNAYQRERPLGDVETLQKYAQEKFNPSSYEDELIDAIDKRASLRKQ